MESGVAQWWIPPANRDSELPKVVRFQAQLIGLHFPMFLLSPLHYSNGHKVKVLRRNKNCIFKKQNYGQLNGKNFIILLSQSIFIKFIPYLFLIS